MIVGIGVDLVDLARFERAVDRTPRLRDRLFAESERTRPLRSLAGRFAAKEALIKALGSSDGVHWLDIVVSNSEEGDPRFEITGETASVIEARGIDRLHLSMSHDAGAAIAFVIAERSEPLASPMTTEAQPSQEEEKA